VFDEMETFEHTKMKPISITVAVTEKTRLIVATKVASMPAKGLLAERSRRSDHEAKEDLSTGSRTTSPAGPKLGSAGS
jgi:hypothetical protein